MTGVTLQLARIGFSAAFGATSLYLAAAARRLFVGQMDWIKRGMTVDGKVVAMNQTGTVDGAVRRKLYAPTVTFSADGERRDFTSALSTENATRFAIGQVVKVRYLPGEPDKVDLDELTSLWWPLAALVVATIVTAVIAALPFVLDPPTV